MTRIPSRLGAAHYHREQIRCVISMINRAINTVQPASLVTSTTQDNTKKYVTCTLFPAIPNFEYSRSSHMLCFCIHI